MNPFCDKFVTLKKSYPRKGSFNHQYFYYSDELAGLNAQLSVQSASAEGTAPTCSVASKKSPATVTGVKADSVAPLTYPANEAPPAEAVLVFEDYKASI